MDKRTRRYVHNMNLTVLTSSRSESRTNAYMVRILLLDGNTFSSCVRSGKHTRIVVYVCQQLYEVVRDSEGGEGERTYIWPAIALHLCLLVALRARQQWRIVQPDGASV
jgi:hypothetical protein